MIDNIDIIKNLLNFEKEGDFYILYVFKRKKDQSTDKANHQSVRTIKSYCVSSIEYLDERYEEIKMLCEVFKARAYIHINKQNHNDVSLNMLKEIVNRLQSGQVNQQYVFDSVVGQVKTQEKRWIVDVDNVTAYDLEPIMDFIDTLRPVGQKTECVVPTKNGYHLITKRFDTMEFQKKYPDMDIQKKNPTILYIPNSLD